MEQPDQEQEQEQQILPTEVKPQEETPEEEEAAPTKSVKNFWERLDEVFQQNSDLRNKINEIVDQFPSEQRVNQGPYRSFVFQPDRISLSSNEDVLPSTQLAGVALSQGGHAAAETFSAFRVRLQRSLVNVKSLQLLSCVIPNAVQNIPDNQVIFFYYRLRTVANSNQGVYNGATNYLAGDIVTFGINTFVCMKANTGLQPIAPYLGVYWLQITLPANTARPNYYDLNSDRMQYLYLPPTFVSPPEESPLAQRGAYNRTFQTYADLVTALNVAAQYYSTIANDVTFEFDEQQNKIVLVPNPTNLANGYFYVPCGYEDPNLSTVASQLFLIYPGIYADGYTLNLRLGYTWNGLFPNPFSLSNIYANNTFSDNIYFYMRPADPNYAAGLQWDQNILTFNSYADLVNTSCVRIYADCTFGSTEEGQIRQLTQQSGLLSIVPVNTTNLGVGFYQNNFNNPLTKVPNIISEIGITMLTDQGQPYLLPNSATVLLELGITYT